MKCKLHPKYKGIYDPRCDCADCWKIRKLHLLAREINGMLFGESVIQDGMDYYGIIGIIEEEIEKFEDKWVNKNFSKYDLLTIKDDDESEQEYDENHDEDEE